MATFVERAAHSIDHVFSLYFYYLFVVLVTSRFCFEGGILVLIAPILGRCILSFHIVLQKPESLQLTLSKRICDAEINTIAKDLNPHPTTI